MILLGFAGPTRVAGCRICHQSATPRLGPGRKARGWWNNRIRRWSGRAERQGRRSCWRVFHPRARCPSHHSAAHDDGAGPNPPQPAPEPFGLRPRRPHNGGNGATAWRGCGSHGVFRTIHHDGPSTPAPRKVAVHAEAVFSSVRAFGSDRPPSAPDPPPVLLPPSRQPSGCACPPLAPPPLTPSPLPAPRHMKSAAVHKPFTSCRYPHAAGGKGPSTAGARHPLHHPATGPDTKIVKLW